MEIPLCIQTNEDFLSKGLVIPRLDDGKSFTGPRNCAPRTRSGTRASIRGDVRHS